MNTSSSISAVWSLLWLKVELNCLSLDTYCCPIAVLCKTEIICMVQQTGQQYLWDIMPILNLQTGKGFLRALPFLQATELSFSISAVITLGRSIFPQAEYLRRNKSISQCFCYLLEIFQCSLRDLPSWASIRSSSMGWISSMGLAEARARNTEFITQVSSPSTSSSQIFQQNEQPSLKSLSSKREESCDFSHFLVHSSDVCCIMATVSH